MIFEFDKMINVSDVVVVTDSYGNFLMSCLVGELCPWVIGSLKS